MNFDRILDDLYVGQKIIDAGFRDALLRQSVTHVISLHEPETIWTRDIGKSLFLPQEDDGSPRDAKQIQAAMVFFSQPDRDVLYVHCQWGLGRAPAMAYALMRLSGWGRTDATNRINCARKVAATYQPNWVRYIPSIESALEHFEKLIGE